MMPTLKQRLQQHQALLAPGICDALTALVAEQAGFQALYLSGASIAYTRLGRSDVGLTTASEVADTLARITERVRVPVAEMCGKLKAALDARASADTLIMARTDALAVEGLEAALERAEAYLACGVDALFIEALHSTEQMQAACARFAQCVPLFANMVEGGKTPVQSAAELGQLGFRIVIFPGGTARAVAHTLQGYYASLHQHQTTAPWKERMLNFDGLNELIGTPALMARGKRYE